MDDGNQQRNHANMTLAVQWCETINIKQSLSNKGQQNKDKQHPDKINTFILQRSKIIRSMEGIQAFTNLKILKCTHNQNLSDLSALKYLHQLEQVNLAYNCINDILGLISSCKTIKKLNLAGNMLSENDNLPKATVSLNLQMSLDKNMSNRVMGQIKDAYRQKYQNIKQKGEEPISFVFQVLNEMSQLEYLDISNNQLKDVTLTIPSLKILICKDNLISSLSFVPKIYSLTTLNMEGNRLSEISELIHLQSCQDLQKICLHNNPLTYSDEYYNNVIKFITFKLRIRRLQFIDEYDISSMRKLEYNTNDLGSVNIELYNTMTLTRMKQAQRQNMYNNNLNFTQLPKENLQANLTDSKMFLSQSGQQEQGQIPLQSMLQSKSYLDYGNELVEQVLKQKQAHPLFAY